jgi:hypothetical protein
VTYTIRSAAYSNPERTSAIVVTKEVGAVAASEQDTPELWGAMTQRGGVAEYTEPATPPRTVRKSVIVTRLIAANKITAAVQAIMAKPDLFARWTAADRPEVRADDADTIAFLQAIGADPAAILAE